MVNDSIIVFCYPPPCKLSYLHYFWECHCYKCRINTIIINWMLVFLQQRKLVTSSPVPKRPRQRNGGFSDETGIWNVYFSRFIFSNRKKNTTSPVIYGSKILVLVYISLYCNWAFAWFRFYCYSKKNDMSMCLQNFSTKKLELNA